VSRLPSAMMMPEPDDLSALEGEIAFHARGIFEILARESERTCYVGIDNAPVGSGLYQSVMREVQRRLEKLDHVVIRRGSGEVLRRWAGEIVSSQASANIVMIAHEDAVRSHLGDLSGDIVIASVGSRAADALSAEQSVDALGVTHLALAMAERDYERVRGIYRRVTGRDLSDRLQFNRLLKGLLTIFPKLIPASVNLDRIRHLAREALNSA